MPFVTYVPLSNMRSKKSVVYPYNRGSSQPFAKGNVLLVELATGVSQTEYACKAASEEVESQVCATISQCLEVL